MLIRILLLGCLASMKILSTPTGDDVHWSPQFGPPGAARTVVSFDATDAGEVMTSEIASPETNSPVRLWDGRSWRTVGVMQGDLAYALAITKFGSEWYVGGTFEAIDNVPMKSLAKWDGSQWRQAAADMGGAIQAMIVHRSELYAAGWPYDETRVTIKRQSNGVWLDIADSGFVGGVTYALATDENYLYAGGSFQYSGANVARWNGQKWEALGAGIDVAEGAAALSLAVYNGVLYAVSGPQFNLTGTMRNKLWRWDGNSWSRINASFEGKSIGPLAVWDGSLYLSGSFTNINGQPFQSFARYDGVQFFPIPNLAGGFLMSPTAGRLYVGGGFTYLSADNSGANAILAPGIGYWDGNAYHSLYDPATGNGTGFSVQALGRLGTDLYAGGTFRAAGSVSANSIAKWNGTSWTPLDTGLRHSSPVSPRVNAIVALADELFVGGTFNQAGETTVANIAVWRGDFWSAAGDGLNGNVIQLVDFNGMMVAGGAFTASGNNPVNYVAGWNGVSWEELGCCLPTIPGGGVTEMAVAGNRLFVAGRIPGEGGLTNSVYELVDSEFVYRAGFDRPIGAMASFEGALYVGGDFQRVNGSLMPHFAKWDGAAWRTVGSQLDAGVSTIVSHQGQLHIAGPFKASSVTPGLNGLARLVDDWRPLGSGIKNVAPAPARVAALCSIGSDLFVGGIFIEAGGTGAHYMARWNAEVDFYASAQVELTISLANEPGFAQIRLPGSGSNTARLETSSDLLNWSSMGMYNVGSAIKIPLSERRQFFRTR